MAMNMGSYNGSGSIDQHTALIPDSSPLKGEQKLEQAYESFFRDATEMDLDLNDGLNAIGQQNAPTSDISGTQGAPQSKQVWGSQFIDVTAGEMDTDDGLNAIDQHPGLTSDNHGMKRRRESVQGDDSNKVLHTTRSATTVGLRCSIPCSSHQCSVALRGKDPNFRLLESAAWYHYDQNLTTNPDHAGRYFYDKFRLYDLRVPDSRSEFQLISAILSKAYTEESVVDFEDRSITLRATRKADTGNVAMFGCPSSIICSDRSFQKLSLPFWLRNNTFRFPTLAAFEWWIQPLDEYERAALRKVILNTTVKDRKKACSVAQKLIAAAFKYPSIEWLVPVMVGNTSTILTGEPFKYFRHVESALPTSSGALTSAVPSLEPRSASGPTTSAAKHEADASSNGTGMELDIDLAEGLRD